MTHSIVPALVRSILEKALAYEWTVQGFGFIRTKLAHVGRIHVWDSRLRVPNVSDVHTHPWPLRSTIISGELVNQRFASHPDSESIVALPYQSSKIKTGEGGGLVGTVSDLKLSVTENEHFTPSYFYTQDAAEIHRTIAIDGTVTLLERPLGPPLEEATVFWKKGAHWVSAEPRPATRREVIDAVDLALHLWYSGIDSIPHRQLFESIGDQRCETRPA